MLSPINGITGYVRRDGGHDGTGFAVNVSDGGDGLSYTIRYATPFEHPPSVLVTSFADSSLIFVPQPSPPCPATPELLDSGARSFQVQFVVLEPEWLKLLNFGGQQDWTNSTDSIERTNRIIESLMKVADDGYVGCFPRSVKADFCFAALEIPYGREWGQQTRLAPGVG
jgi:hypothetical protein